MQKIKKQNLAKIFFGIISAAFLLAQNASAATPTISNVSGTIANGQTLTISGGNMVDEDKTNWSSFFTTHSNASSFEGGINGQVLGTDAYTPGPDGYINMGSGGSGSGVYDTSVHLLGSTSAKFHVAGTTTKCPDDNLMSYNYYNIDGSPTEMYLRTYVRYYSATNNWPNSHVKLFLDQTNSNSSYIEFTHPSGGGDSGYPDRIEQRLWGNSGYDTETDSNAFHSGNIPSGTMQSGKWYLVEAYFRRTGRSPGHITIWVDGTQVMNEDRISTTNDLIYKYFNFGIVNACGGLGSTYDLTAWMDGMAVSSSRIYGVSLIEISGDNGNTWTYQEPTYLGDTSSTIKANLPTLTASGYLLRVTNNRQETSTTYNISGSSDTTPPSTPQGLSVS